MLSIGIGLRCFRLSRWYIWESSWTHCFQGFSCPEQSREASLHWRRILVLRQSASVVLPGVIRGAVLNDPPCSWGSPPHEVTPTDSSVSVGSDRSVSAGRVVAGNPRRSFLVARSLRAQHFLWCRCPLSSSYGPTPRTWAGGFTWTSSSLQACGLRKTSSARSASLLSIAYARELLAIESALKWFAPLLAGSSVAVFAVKSTAVSYLRNQGGTRSSGLWAPEDVERSINARELLAIESALKWFAPLLAGSSVVVFAVKSTAVSYLRNQGGTRSSFLNSIAQRILRWAEDLSVVISPQFIMGKHNVLADALSRPNQILGSEWMLKQEVFRDLCRRWPVSIGLFATSQNHSCSLYFSPYHNHNAMGTDALLRNWNGWQAYAFPTWSLIQAGLKKLRSPSGVLLTIVAPYWPQRPWFPDLLDLLVASPVALPQSSDLLRQLHFLRFHLGVSRLCLHAW